VAATPIAAWQEAGLNRFSLGVQTLDAARLAMLGRVHSALTARQAIRLFSGLPNWSADLMFGWEGQTVAQLQSELAELLEFSPPHVSLYQLTLEPRTRFGVLAAKNLVRCAAPDRQADLYLAA
jgi:oxygen-independent coproporphyrinogen-3 oxidase